MPEPNAGEREFEIGKDEAWFANVKRTFDEFLNESLESIRRNRTIVDKIASDAQQFDNQRQVIANQSLQNAVTTADQVAKQSIRHESLASDRQWNVDEQGQIVKAISRSDTFKEAVAAATAAAVAEALKPKE